MSHERAGVVQERAEYGLMGLGDLAGMSHETERAGIYE